MQKCGRMPTAEVVAWPRRLEPRKRRVVVERIVVGADVDDRCWLIDRLIRSFGVTPMEFAEISMQLLEENHGLQSTKYQRIAERKRA